MGTGALAPMRQETSEDGMGKKKDRQGDQEARIRALVERLVEHGHVNLARAWAKKLPKAPG
jgi:hypothetical protein